jgi:hypothetical protein
MLGGDYSSKFSAWLAHGCISPRYIHSEVRSAFVSLLFSLCSVLVSFCPVLVSVRPVLVSFCPVLVSSLSVSVSFSSLLYNLRPLLLDKSVLVSVFPPSSVVA